MIVRLGAAGAAARGALGGKAASLDRMAELGLPVPKGFVLGPAAFEAWLGEAGRAGLAGLAAALGERGPAAKARALARAAELEAGAPTAPGPALEAALGAALDGLDAAHGFAVRSSGSLEDLAGHSFAGLYETALRVPAAGVGAAVAACFRSLFAARVVAYLADRGLGGSGLCMAVVVQEMVPADWAGVLFTVHPMTGLENDTLVELVTGTGEGLVGGARRASRIVLRGEPPALVLDSHFEAEVAERDRAGILERTRGPLLEAARRMERDSGLPLDLEFAFAGSAVWLLQARPITTLGFAPHLGEWTNADFNEGGVGSGICSPFMWSLYERIWEEFLPEYLRRIGLRDGRGDPASWGRVFFGVPYWNVGAIKACLRKIPGFSEKGFDTDLGIEKDYPGGDAVTPLTLGNLVGALGVLVRMYLEFYRQQQATRALLARARDLESYLDVDLEAASDEVLSELYASLLRKDYVRVESTYFMTIFNSSNAKLEFKSRLDGLNAGGGKGRIAYLDLMSGMKGLKTLESVHGLHRLAKAVRADPDLARRVEAATPAALAAALAEPADAFGKLAREFVAAHAHHSRRELDPRVARWDEDLEFVMGQVQQACAAFDPARDPAAVEERQHRRYLEERARARAACGWNVVQRWFFEDALERSREYCRLREETRDVSTRVYRIVRRYTLEVAGRLVARGVLERPGDVFLLRHQEVLDAYDGALSTAEARRLVRDRTAHAARFAAFRPPREIGAGLRARAEAAPADGAGALVGVGGAPGVVRGRVRVVRDVADGGRLRKGEILVAEFTDPGWTPLFGVIGGVVTEVGGVLSHAAVIAREYGLPAVLSVRGATRDLKDGDEVEVDGSRGEVRVLPR